MNSFEDRMRVNRHGFLYKIDNAGYVDFEDAIKLSIEADEALATKDATITRLTALNTANQEYIDYLFDALQGAELGYAPRRVEGERLRAAIKEFENVGI